MTTKRARVSRPGNGLVGPSLEEWMVMPPAKAARIVARRLGLDADRERKLQLIIKSERKRRANAPAEARRSRSLQPDVGGKVDQ